METLAIAIFILGLSPATNAAELRFRVEVAEAIVQATPDAHVQRLLASIARWESGYRPEVARCSIKGDGGRALSAFQIHPRSKSEATAICASILGSARLAAQRVEESLSKCSHLPKEARLAIYASGSCDNRGGRAASRLRWVD